MLNNYIPRLSKGQTLRRRADELVRRAPVRWLCVLSMTSDYNSPTLKDALPFPQKGQQKQGSLAPAGLFRTIRFTIVGYQLLRHKIKRIHQYLLIFWAT